MVNIFLLINYTEEHKSRKLLPRKLFSKWQKQRRINSCRVFWARENFFICSAAITKYHRQGGYKQQKLLSHSAEAARPGSWRHHGQVRWGPLPGPRLLGLGSSQSLFNRTLPRALPSCTPHDVSTLPTDISIFWGTIPLTRVLEGGTQIFKPQQRGLFHMAQEDLSGYWWMEITLQSKGGLLKIYFVLICSYSIVTAIEDCLTKGEKWTPIRLPLIASAVQLSCSLLVLVSLHTSFYSCSRGRAQKWWAATSTWALLHCGWSCSLMATWKELESFRHTSLRSHN